MHLSHCLCCSLCLSYCTLMVFADAGEDHWHLLIDRFDKNADGQLNLEEFEALYEELFGKTEEDHGHSHARWQHKKSTKDLVIQASRRGGYTPQMPRATETVECYPADDLFFDNDLNRDENLNEDELKTTAPSMTLMILDGCETDESSDNECSKSKAWEAWLFGLIAVCIISLVSLVGVAIIPFDNQVAKDHIIPPLISFAIGALLGDALLHIIPHGLGVDGTKYEGSTGDANALMSMAVLGIFCFYLIERIINHLSASIQQPAGPKSGTELGSGSVSEEELSTSKEGESLVTRLKRVKAAGWLNLLTDSVHNFVDGVAVGVSFAKGPSLGLATSIAVFFHELPQEFGDFAILVHSGFTKPQALMLNFAVSLTAVLGCVLGLAIGLAEGGALNWLLLWTAGGFLYIALADMVPELAHGEGWVQTGMQLGFMALGYLIMLIISLTEKDATC